MRVELDIFSGRPNPAWELSSQEAAALAELLTELPRAGQPPAEGGLGYRGFTLSTPGGSPGLPTWARVYDGVLAVLEHGEPMYYRDANGIERWLSERAAERGYGDLLG